jgi:DNA-binding IscR family transcriptional regulator
MLRFTKKTDYGLMAMQYLATHQGDGAVGVKRIAEERGGYRLGLPPSAVTIGQVIRALEGPVAVVRCMSDHGECPQAITELLDTMTIAELIDENGAGDELIKEARHGWH